MKMLGIFILRLIDTQEGHRQGKIYKRQGI